VHKKSIWFAFALDIEFYSDFVVTVYDDESQCGQAKQYSHVLFVDV